MNTRSLLLAPLVMMPALLHAQPFITPCTAPDNNVEALYRNDADRLALERIFRNGTMWVDSVAIDTAWSRTAMNALLAVYNSNLPARDTVVDMLNIHVWPAWPLRSFIVGAQSTLPWMQQLALGNIPTGTPAIDQLFATYGVYLANYHAWPSGHFVVLNTQTNVNISALTALFAAQPGVIYAEPNHGFGDGNTITDSVHVDHVHLVYSHGWGDCPAGCMYRRYWEFNVFPDCSVEYMGSHGGTLPLLPTHVPRMPDPGLSVHPNPADEVLHVQLHPGMAGDIGWEVRDAMGRVISQGRALSGNISVPVEEFAMGTYLLVLRTTEGPLTRRFVKQ